MEGTVVLLYILQEILGLGFWPERNDASGSRGEVYCSNLTYPLAQHNPGGLYRNLKALKSTVGPYLNAKHVIKCNCQKNLK